ncbi:hypothetical protein DL93DRAFT_786234 [Clavulina sp. PMI_390]|nr:hypothetical protein DL93DRAFT_786234 [Clavulina sp. PMI_390]
MSSVPSSSKRSRAESMSEMRGLPSLGNKRSRPSLQPTLEDSALSTSVPGPSQSADLPQVDDANVSSRLSGWPKLLRQLQSIRKHDLEAAKIILDGAPRTMAMENVTSELVHAISSCPPPVFTSGVPRHNALQTMHHSRQLFVHTPVAFISSNAQYCQEREPVLLPLNPHPDEPAPHIFSPIRVESGAPTPFDPHPMELAPLAANSNDYIRVSYHPTLYGLAPDTAARVQLLFSVFQEHEIAFAMAMAEAQVLVYVSVQAQTDPDLRRPHPLLQGMADLMTAGDITELLEFTSHDSRDVIRHLNEWYAKYARASAQADAVLLHAIDVCATLGGMELPRWPPCSKWRGAYFPASLLPLGTTQSNTVHAILRLIRRYERWGVPLWLFIANETHTRFDYDPVGDPLPAPYQEAQMQGIGRLQNEAADENRFPRYSRYRVTHRCVLPNPQGLNTSYAVPSGRYRHELQQAIMALVLHTATQRVRWSDFDDVARGVLGPEIWNCRRYEASYHALGFTSPEPWNRVRESYEYCAHIGALLALYCIPAPWRDRSLEVANQFGEQPNAWRDTTSKIVPIISKTSWLELQVDDWRNDDGEMVEVLATSGAETGVLGWRFIKSPQQCNSPKDQSKAGLRYTACFAFKTTTSRTHFAEQFKGSDHALRPTQPGNSVNDAKVFVNTFRFITNPWYIAIVYAMETSMTDRKELLSLAPQYAVSSSLDGIQDTRNEEIVTVEHHLRYRDLFEYPLFPPLLSPPASVSAPSQALQPLDSTSLSKSALRKLALAAEASGELDHEHSIRLLRLSIILEVLADSSLTKSFTCRLLHSEGPYSKILKYLVTSLQQSMPAECSFTSRHQRDGVAPYHEALHMTNRGNIEIIYNVDQDASRAGMITSSELGLWYQQVAASKAAMLAKPSPRDRTKAAFARKVQAEVKAQMAQATGGASGS